MTPTLNGTVADLTRRRPAPGPGANSVDRAAMLRVNQAGEYGATRIYKGQLAVLGDRHPMSREIARMAAQEERHRIHFDEMLATCGVRPTLLQPAWHFAGFALGAATALLGPEAAMACTAAVETEIDNHYGHQLDQMGADDAALRDTVTKFRAEEVEHRETAFKHGAEQAPAYPLLSGIIRLGCRAAIAISKKI